MAQESVFVAQDKRVKVTIHDTQLLRKNDEKRHKFNMSVTLTDGDDTMVGMAGWVQNAYAAMLKSANLKKRDDFEARFENIAIEFFPTFKGRRFFAIIVGATLSGFRMERVGKGDDCDVLLHFTAKFPGRKEIHEWTFDHKSAECWASFEQQQGQLNLEGDQESDEDESEDEE